MNNKNAVQLINHILDHPKQWDQRLWHCGTTHCFAGHAQIMSGNEPNDNTCSIDAQRWLELTSYDADWLFDSYRTLTELHRFVLMSVQGVEFNEDGYDKYGFNIDGFNKDGYDEDGFNIYGFNKDGFNIYGYDENGFNKDGYDKDGYDKNGFNKDGFNKLPKITITEQTNEQ